MVSFVEIKHCTAWCKRWYSKRESIERNHIPTNFMLSTDVPTQINAVHVISQLERNKKDPNEVNMPYEAFCNITRNEIKTRLKHKTVAVGDKEYKMPFETQLE